MDIIIDISNGSFFDISTIDDLKNYDYHYIIFNDRIFKVDRDYPEQYEETKEYGLKRGILEEYLPNASWAK